MDYEVIIVGSGPSGTSTALHLAQLNPALATRTLVLERDRHPRHKLCGGACTPEVEQYLQRLGLNFDEVAHVEVDWAWLHFQGHGFRLRFNQDYAFSVVHRNEFDSWLADHVRRRGIRLLEETRVVHVRRIDDGVEVETDKGSFTARVVVGADGVSGMVRRLVPKGKKAAPLARVVELVTPATPEQMPPTMADDDALLEFSCMNQGVQGYVWSFPTQIEGQRKRNWGVYDSRILDRKSAGSLRPVADDWLSQAGYQLKDYHLDGHPIRLFEPQAEFSAPHVLLVGDAAGVDATFGEGISLALGYGELAAGAIDDAFRRDDFSFAGYRQSVLRSRLGKTLRLRTRTARLLNRVTYAPLQKFLFWRMGFLFRWFITKILLKWGDPAEPMLTRRQKDVVLATDDRQTVPATPHLRTTKTRQPGGKQPQ